jgi:MFS family permease
MRLMAAIPVGAILGGFLARRVGVALTALGGVAACALGLYLLAAWRPDTSADQMTRDLLVTGLGFGLQLAPLTSVVVAWAGPARAGVASALATVMRMIGMLIGLSSLTSWGLERFNALVAGLALPFPVADESAQISQQRIDAYQRAVLDASLSVFGEIFLVAAGVCVLALVPALLLRVPARQ